MRMRVQYLAGLAQWVKGSGVTMSCGVGHRLGLNLVLLWLWCRPATTAPIGPLAWELPYALKRCGPKQTNKQISFVIEYFLLEL